MGVAIFKALAEAANLIYPRQTRIQNLLNEFLQTKNINIETSRKGKPKFRENENMNY